MLDVSVTISPSLATVTLAAFVNAKLAMAGSRPVCETATEAP
jgi:hypothetical protein